MIPTSAQAKAEQIVLPSEETLTVPSFDCPLKYVVYPGVQRRAESVHSRRVHRGSTSERVAGTDHASSDGLVMPRSRDGY